MNQKEPTNTLQIKRIFVLHGFYKIISALRVKNNKVIDVFCPRGEILHCSAKFKDEGCFFFIGAEIFSISRKIVCT